MKVKDLLSFTNSSMFQLLPTFPGVAINGFNNLTTATRFHDLDHTSGATLGEAAGYPKLFRPHSHFLGTDESRNPFFMVTDGVTNAPNGRDNSRGNFRGNF